MGVVGMMLLSRLDYHAVLDKAPILYLIGLLALVAVLALGHTRFGAKRWLPVLGEFFQVSELVKLIIIVVLARFFTEVRTDRLSLADLCKAAVLTGVPAGPDLLQPDLGTAMVLVPVVVVGAYLAGMQWKHAAVLAARGGYDAAGRLALPEAVSERAGDHVSCARKTIPRGRATRFCSRKSPWVPEGFGARGWGTAARISWASCRSGIPILFWRRSPRRLGFAGVFVALVLYTALLLRLIQNAQRAKDRAGMFLVMGVAAILGFHVLVNVAMVIGFMPVTGIPLPLMSYGGSATLFVFLALGLVMNVRLRRFVN